MPRLVQCFQAPACISIAWRFCEKPCDWAPPSELLNVGVGQGWRISTVTRFLVKLRWLVGHLHSEKHWTKWSAWLKQFLGALWGSWLNTDSDSAWIWAWESAFFLNVFQVISALGSIDQPLIRDDEAWEIETYRYVSPIQLRCPVSSFILVNL